MRKQLSKSDIVDINHELENYGFFIDKKCICEITGDTTRELLSIDGKTAFYRQGKEWIPTLKLLQTKSVLPLVIVDMGAVPYVIKGADIMRPGIVALADGINTGQLVTIVDEKHQKAIAVGRMLFDSSTARAMQKGKIIEMVHYIGDEIWKGIA